ncbi:uncharacterized protein [Porites lutea]|uniref:uncharacterized protein n=1 Tax=Porites lutea TaxID=51062 RepID=UPI003CC6A327
MNDAECLAEFRFRTHDLQILSEVLQIPDSFRCYQRSVVDGMEGLCILLRRLSYPCRYSDMISRFGLPVPVLSMVSNDVLDFIYNTHRHRITQWNHNVLNPAALQIYSNVISGKGAALHNCFGFVDGTVRPVCRPGEHQRVIYNGHKRVHALKFQCVALPNGLIGNLFGPVGKFCGECLFFIATIESILLYGCESWALSKAQEKSLDGTYTRMLRKALNIHWSSHIPNQQLYGDLPAVSNNIASRRLQLAGHCYRHPELSTQKLVLWEPTHGHRGRGRPNTTYIDTRKRHTGAFEASEIAALMADKRLWKDLVVASLRATK